MEFGIVVCVIEEGDFCEGVCVYFVDKDCKLCWVFVLFVELCVECVWYFLMLLWKLFVYLFVDFGVV